MPWKPVAIYGYNTSIQVPPPQNVMPIEIESSFSYYLSTTSNKNLLCRDEQVENGCEINRRKASDSNAYKTLLWIGTVNLFSVSVENEI